VFTQPQVAYVGATEQQLREDGVDYRVGLARYSDTAYGWAIQDDTGFCKILAQTRQDGSVGALLGAHIMGPQAATLIHPLVLAIPGQALIERPYWIHPAPTEVVKEALVTLSGRPNPISGRSSEPHSLLRKVPPC
jgi:mycothione reductase